MTSPAMPPSPPPTLLPTPHPDAAEGLAVAQRTHDGADPEAAGARLRLVVADHPLFLAGWAQLAAWALDAGQPVEAYAFARVGYHRGLDQIRAAGWRGRGPVPWSHEPNRGFLACVHGLMRAAAAIRETVEAQRCRDFLLELDPDDAQGVRGQTFGILPMA